jgi:D-3-phosphoglycerate dehydrogenase / 2-oxoglutarate reductase
MPTVVLTTPSAELRRRDLERLPGVTVRERYELVGTQDEQLLAAGVEDAWAVIAGSERYGRVVFEAVRGLRAVLRWGVGFDAIDVAAATAAGVAVLVTPGANADAVADMAVALMLACIRRLPELDAAVRQRSWRPAVMGGDLAGAIVGIVGLGAVGRAVVARVRGFGCRVLAVEPHPDGEFCAAHGIELTTLAELLPRVDVLSLHAPLTDATRHLLGARELARLPAHAVVVNTSRGPLIDQAALADALRAGTIAAAGLDVFEREPLTAENPLTALANVILTPHVSSFTRYGMQRTGAVVVAQVRELVAGRLPAGCVNPKAWSPATP